MIRDASDDDDEGASGNGMRMSGFDNGVQTRLGEGPSVVDERDSPQNARTVRVCACILSLGFGASLLSAVWKSIKAQTVGESKQDRESGQSTCTITDSQN